ncbi:MAG: hypothetical protein DRP78_03190 [Candidatus Omnitrophota bacterium]|nr:MAG: hypothetical protein DRP78_03190 [Candidatus Omnitrophota bacterium]
MGKMGISGIVVSFLLVTNIVFAQGIGEDLRKVVELNFAGLEKNNIEQSMKTIHTQSPAYLQTKMMVEQLVDDFSLKYELAFFKYITTDDGYALARVKQKTTKIKGPAFKDNLVDAIYVFTKEGNTWKIWTQAIIAIEYLN